MRTFKLITIVEIDETNRNVPSLKQFIDEIENTLSTPDNDHFGIIKIETTGEEVENF